MRDDVLTRSIRETLAQEFDGLKIVGLEINDSYDQDDEHVMLIRVVFESDGKLDAHALSGFMRHLRSTLEQNGESLNDMPFPVMSFAAKSDLNAAELRGLSTEAA